MVSKLKEKTCKNVKQVFSIEIIFQCKVKVNSVAISKVLLNKILIHKSYWTNKVVKIQAYQLKLTRIRMTNFIIGKVMSMNSKFFLSL